MFACITGWSDSLGGIHLLLSWLVLADAKIGDPPSVDLLKKIDAGAHLLTSSRRCPDEPPQQTRERYRKLTDEIERVLREVVHATESWELHHQMHRVRKLFRAERSTRAGSKLDKPGIAERTLGFARVWAGYYTRLESHPEQTAALSVRIAEYDQDLRALRLEMAGDGSISLDNSISWK